MIKEMYTAAIGMLPDQTRLEVSANNIANAKTTGFKREGVFQRRLLEAKFNLHGIPGDVEQTDPMSEKHTDLSQGAFEKTDNPFEFALNNRGYFTVLNDNGEELLTRAGRFTLSDDGTITTPQGYPLMGETGTLVIPQYLLQGNGLNSSEPLSLVVGATGEMFVNDESIGRLQVLDAENPQTLERVSNTHFKPRAETILETVSPAELDVKQGFIEVSNVDIVEEMVAMIQTQRSFELGNRVIRTNDDTLDRSIEIGRVL